MEKEQQINGVRGEVETLTDIGILTLLLEKPDDYFFAEPNGERISHFIPIHAKRGIMTEALCGSSFIPALEDSTIAQRKMKLQRKAVTSACQNCYAIYQKLMLNKTAD